MIFQEKSSNRAPFSRNQYLKILEAALIAENFSFASEAVLKWLAIYPGDLEAGLLYARALLGKGQHRQAILILDGLCMADPEFVRVAETCWKARDQISDLQGVKEGNNALKESALFLKSELINPTYVFALSGKVENSEDIEGWGSGVRRARKLIDNIALDDAEIILQRVLNEEMAHPLVAATHLKLIARKNNLPLEFKHDLAKRYHHVWPDCLVCSLMLAEWSLESGNSDLAVALLHQAAARDVSGQVARRLWGENHAYSSLWPTRLELALQIPLPADVASVLGWNRLPDGVNVAVEPAIIPDLGEEKLTTQQQLHEKPNTQAEEDDVFPLSLGSVDIPPNGLIEKSILSLDEDDEEILDNEIESVADEFERIAKNLGLPGILHLDSRYPVYVVFSVRSKLLELYGSDGFASLEAEMENLVKAVRDWRYWGARYFFADDRKSTEPLGIRPAKPDDPWGLKLALSDLDAALAKRGERIGALLIVGGPEVVPFHHLPNPVDDQDSDVPSDNPYATRDENYFIPEWPVGRLPGGAGNDSTLLLRMLQGIREHHEARTKRQPFYLRWYSKLSGWIHSITSNSRSNFGYTAAVWRRAAVSVFRPIGDPEKLLVSPPIGISGVDAENLTMTGSRNKSPLNPLPVPAGLLGYFNLHGLVDAAEWFGQRDPREPSQGVDYPIALRPRDIGDHRARDNNLPKIIFSEACYGIHIQGRTLNDAISLKFLESGSMAVVGSTCMAYGSLGTPLIAADLLGHTFWRYTQQGVAAGEALRQAKIYLAGEMDRRQGYLDGEDQKTLISFNLYGDPLAQLVNKNRYPKTTRYLVKPIEEVKTVSYALESDSLDVVVNSSPIPADVMASVRGVVAKYLPGMSDADVVYTPEKERCYVSLEGYAACKDFQKQERRGGRSTNRKANGTSKSPQEDKTDQSSIGSHSLVTLSKKTVSSEGVHTNIAILTLDEGGKVVKLVVSR